jgi:hypothetical protein
MARSSKDVRLSNAQIDKLLALDDATLRATLQALKVIPSVRELWREQQAREEVERWEQELRGEVPLDPLNTGRHTAQTPAAQSSDDEEE